MKYPQLVSARAVSAISDWLVTQLEQLGVDASLVYSRLLLSLLHTPLQINALDLAEISDIKVGNLGRSKLNSSNNISNNGGNYRRFSAADTEALKRLAAIDSLLEAVSSDQQVSKIETLIDELSLKLREIEKQNSLDDSSVYNISDGFNDVNATDQDSAHLDSMKKNSATPEDPAKRYYRAFPALSDQSAYDYNSPATHLLSWPRTDLVASDKGNQSTKPLANINANTNCSGSVLGIKKKPKRRRINNAAMTSASSSSNHLNAATKSSALVGRNDGNGNNSNRAQQSYGNNHHHLYNKKKSSSIWDTDFDGAWEMGHDLIREFVMKQNNRNRSISESDARKFVKLDDDMLIGANFKESTADAKDEMDVMPNQVASNEFSMKKCDDGANNAEENMMRIAAAATSVLFGKEFDIADNLSYQFNLNVLDSGSFSSASTVTDTSVLMLNKGKPLIRSEGYATPDTLSSLNEIDAGNYSMAPRRLYEREVSNESINGAGIAGESGSIANSDCVDSGCDETNHLAAFEAKFDHSVEALWNDSKDDEVSANPPPLPPLTSNIQSFWFNYYRHHYNSSEDQNATPNQSIISPMYPISNSNVTAIDQIQLQTNQLSSIPININTTNQNRFAASQSNSLNPMMSSYSSGTSTATVGGMNLKASIWTDNANNNEDDVSFYANAKLWGKEHASKVEQPAKINFLGTEAACGIGSINMNAVLPTGANTNIEVGTYENPNFLKWSDCSFEMPFVPTHRDTSAGPPQTNNDEKIRRNLFENSYFYDAKSLQMMSNFKSGPSLAHAEPTSTAFQFNQPQDVKSRVTLTNHSTNSCFKAVQPLSIESKQELIHNRDVRKYQQPPVDAQIENEDLLTSERTRFRPIKQTYVDGYTFDISNEIDEVNYERSASGTLHYESEMYREYYVYDEDGNGGGPCGADSTSDDTEFILKYCVRQNEKSCQTDDVPPKYVSPPNTSMLSKANNMKQFNSLIGREAAVGNQMVYLLNNVANRPHITSTHQFHDNCLHNNSLNQMAEIAHNNHMNIDGWTLAENRKRCNNNNNSHALWEHCMTCSSDVVSMPANRLLKDELSAEGDEIMSDLKYMQNLYIGSDWEDDDSDAMIEETVDDDDGLMQPLEPKVKSDSKKTNSLALGATTFNEDDANAGDGYKDDQSTTNHIYYNVSKLISDLLKPEKAQTLVQAIGEKCQGHMGQTGMDEHICNISTSNNHPAQDCLNLDNNLQLQTENGSGNCSIVANNNNDYFGSLWGNDKNSIWRKEPPVGADTIWSNTVQVDGNKAIDKNMITSISDSSSYDNEKTSGKLSDQWEHANLEKIWSCPPSVTEVHPESLEMKLDHQTCQLIQEKAILQQVNLEQDNHDKQLQSYSILNDDQQALQKLIKVSSNIQNDTPTNVSIANDNITEPQHQQHHHHHRQHEQIHKLINNRSDRKRRHSATSQNQFFDQFSYALTNCDAIDGIKKLATKTATATDYVDGRKTVHDDGGDDGDMQRTTTTTIITCKYWAATDSFCLTSTLAINNSNNNNSSSSNVINHNNNFFNCYQQQYQQQPKYQPEQLIDTINGNDSLTMHPTTFLRQVAAMVARPLTR